jgi:alginate O-acetyltransferase complex protein AlgI
VITSGLFWIVMAVAAVAYWQLPRFRDWTLILASALVIGWSDWRSLAAVTVLSLFSFAVARKAAELPKWVVGIAVVFVLSFLLFYKYVPPIHDAIFGATKVAKAVVKANPKAHDTAINGVTVAVPLGASYFTFKLVHYLVDSRRRQLPKHDLKSFVGYMFFLPMFAAGPIERFDDYLANRSAKLTKEHIAAGGTRILYGLVKKMVIVDILLNTQRTTIGTKLVDAIPFYKAPATVDALLDSAVRVNPLFAWQFVVHRFVLWYLDFSAYSDVAIGVALFFGIRLMENFDWPLLSPNPTAFWKRYHASLSAWCQRYVYFPVMGRARNPYVAVFATMMVMGIWHSGSLNYLLWGVYQATVLSIYVTWTRVKRWRKWKLKSNAMLVFGTVLTALAVCASAVFPSTSNKGPLAALRLLGMLVGIHS